MVLKIGGSVEKVNGRELSYADFAKRYLAGSRPVVLTGITEGWNACKDWVLSDGKPNLRFFSERFGKSRVQVADCGNKEFSDQKRMEMTVAEFIERWIRNPDERSSSFYLKDWHFVKEYPEYVAYCTPIFFLDDWLNLYLDKFHMHDDPESYRERDEISCSDYRFVYMGAKGTWTPLHADVFRSYSWSANICGRKQWFFLSPSQSHLVFDRYMKSSVYDIFEDVCSSEYPGFDKASWWECIQEPNEVIFVPSGWYHQVHNLEDTISINHNWFNSYNISSTWDLLLSEYNEAKRYIEDIKDDCDDFERLCQRNLAANAGMNFRDFFVLVSRFTLANFTLLYHLRSDGFEDTDSRIVRLLLFNLESLRSIGSKIISSTGPENCRNFFIDLRETLQDRLFMELCLALVRTYRSICERSGEVNISRSIQDLREQNRPGFLEFCRPSCITSPDELVAFIDSVLNLYGSSLHLF